MTSKITFCTGSSIKYLFRSLGPDTRYLSGSKKNKTALYNCLYSYRGYSWPLWTVSCNILWDGIYHRWILTIDSNVFTSIEIFLIDFIAKSEIAFFGTGTKRLFNVTYVIIVGYFFNWTSNRIIPTGSIHLPQQLRYRYQTHWWSRSKKSIIDLK